MASHKDKNELKCLLDSEKNYTQLKSLFDKYNISDLIMEDINAIKSNIYLDIESLSEEKISAKWKQVFPFFVTDLLEYCESVTFGLQSKWNT